MLPKGPPTVLCLGCAGSGSCDIAYPPGRQHQVTSSADCRVGGDGVDAMAGAPKRARVGEIEASGFLRGVLHAGGVSKKGLVELLQAIRSVAEMPRGIASKWSVDAEALRRFMEVRLMIPMKWAAKEGSFEWELADPGKLVAYSLVGSSSLAQAFARAAMEQPPSPERPWRCIVGFDEFAPGNKLKVDNRRKAMVLSFTFAELGPHALQSEWGWFTAVVLRSCVIHEIEGGWPACLAAFLRALLLGANGLTSAGIPLALPNGPVLLFARWFVGCCTYVLASAKEIKLGALGGRSVASKGCRTCCPTATASVPPLIGAEGLRSSLASSTTTF